MAETTKIVPLRIGIDFGGVLTKHDRYHRLQEEEEQEGHRSVEINMPNALESLIKLKEAGHQIYLISFCGERRAIETKRSILRTLPREDFFDGLYFVHTKVHKADICHHLGCDIMIDDQLKVLNNIRHVIPTMKLIWFSPNDTNQCPNMIKAESWCDLMKTIDDILINQTIRHKPNSRVKIDEKIHKI